MLEDPDVLEHCTYFGAYMNDETMVCLVCRKSTPAIGKYCKHCGTPLMKDVPKKTFFGNKGFGLTLFRRFKKKKPAKVFGWLLLLVIIAFYTLPHLLPYSVLRRAGMQSLIPAETTPTIRNPRWITARPDAWSEEVIFPISPPCRFECTFEHPNEHVEVLPDNDLTRVFNDSSDEKHPFPLDSVHSLRFRSREPYPVIVRVTIKPYTP